MKHSKLYQHAVGNNKNFTFYKFLTKYKAPFKSRYLAQDLIWNKKSRTRYLKHDLVPSVVIFVLLGCLIVLLGSLITFIVTNWISFH